MAKTAVQKMFDAYVEGNWQTMNWTGEKASHAWSAFCALVAQVQDMTHLGMESMKVIIHWLSDVGI